MHSQHPASPAPKKSKIIGIALLLLAAIVVVIAAYYHLQISAYVAGGVITVLLVHLILAGGAAHLVPKLKKRFHGEPVEPNPPTNSP